VLVGRLSDVRDVLKSLSPEDVAVLDAALEERVRSPLWRTTLPIALNTLGSVFVCSYNVEPAGLLVVERSGMAARIRVLAVAPDLRRRHIASKMLHEVEKAVADRKLSWLWMDVPSANAAAVRCALAMGYKRYLPQYLHRDAGGLLPVRAEGVSLELLDEKSAASVIKKAAEVEAELGDAWAHEFVTHELLPRLSPPAGKTWLCYAGEHDVGIAHLGGTTAHPSVWLWLDKTAWNSEIELAVFKAVLNTLVRVPQSIDLRVGSGDHLRQSAARFKALGFKPMMEERVVFAKRVSQ
jgi:GNAT superfamily N-acetyltransferase